MNPEPLSPEQVDVLLRPDPRTRTADMLVLRDALLRMSGALEKLSGAVSQLQKAAKEMDRAVERERPTRGD